MDLGGYGEKWVVVLLSRSQLARAAVRGRTGGHVRERKAEMKERKLCMQCGTLGNLTLFHDAFRRCVIAYPQKAQSNQTRFPTTAEKVYPSRFVGGARQSMTTRENSGKGRGGQEKK